VRQKKAIFTPVRSMASRAPEPGIEPPPPRLSEEQRLREEAEITLNYPENVPFINAQLKSPYRKYDDQQGRRDFDVPVNEQEELLTIMTPDTHTGNGLPKYTVALRRQLYFALAVAGLAGTVYALDKNIDPKFTPRQYPYDNLKREKGYVDGAAVNPVL